MKAVIHINMDNAAFQEFDDPSQELARILRQLGNKVNHNTILSVGWSLPVFDINGNDVGYLGIEE